MQGDTDDLAAKRIGQTLIVLGGGYLFIRIAPTLIQKVIEWL